MKTNLSKVFFSIAVLCGVLPLLAEPTGLENAPEKFPDAVQYELGKTQFAPGDSITIQELRGDRKEIGPGGTFCVIGNYTLSSREEATLAFYAATPNSGPTATDAKQRVHIKKGTGSFRLIKTVNEQGYLHLSFYPRAGGGDFGGIYFGQEPWVTRDDQTGGSAVGNKSK